MKVHHAKKAGKGGAKAHKHAHGVASARHSRHSGGSRRISTKKR